MEQHLQQTSLSLLRQSSVNGYDNLFLDLYDQPIQTTLTHQLVIPPRTESKPERLGLDEQLPHVPANNSYTSLYYMKKYIISSIIIVSTIIAWCSLADKEIQKREPSPMIKSGSTETYATWTSTEVFTGWAFEELIIKSKDEKASQTWMINQKDQTYQEWKDFYLARNLWSKELQDAENTYQDAVKSRIAWWNIKDTEIAAAKDNWIKLFKTFQETKGYLSYLEENKNKIEAINTKLQTLMPEGIPMEDFNLYIPQTK